MQVLQQALQVSRLPLLLAPWCKAPKLPSRRLIALPYLGFGFLAVPSASLHCFCILGVWSMSKDTKGHTPKRSPLPAAGLAVGKRSDDGEFYQPCPWPFVISPILRPARVHLPHHIDTICCHLPHTPHHPALLDFALIYPQDLPPRPKAPTFDSTSSLFLMLNRNTAYFPSQL